MVAPVLCAWTGLSVALVSSPLASTRGSPSSLCLDRTVSSSCVLVFSKCPWLPQFFVLGPFCKCRSLSLGFQTLWWLNARLRLPHATDFSDTARTLHRYATNSAALRHRLSSVTPPTLQRYVSNFSKNQLVFFLKRRMCFSSYSNSKWI